MDDETARRLAENQALYRSVNERIKDAGRELGGPDHPYEFICECSDLSCSERITATLREYEAVRARADRFLLLDGHEVADVERVVDRNSRFLTVEKIGEAKRAVI